MVDHRKLDFDLVRSWLEDCEHKNDSPHGGCHDRQQRDIPFCMNVIDCFTRKIVKLDKGNTYLTLSYVWGEAGSCGPTTDGERYASGQVPNPAPATIEDAMEVVRALHYRYLWVDRYCIPVTDSTSGHPQQHDTERHVQIRNMDLIYEGALATIVAVSGIDATSGLPGISTARRVQPFGKTNVGTLASSLKHLSEHMAASKWIQRAWTYQEAILSRRCLFFTKEQIFFSCKEYIRAESFIQYPSVVEDSSRDTLSPSLMQSSGRSLARGSSKPRFEDHLREYTSRSLSRDIDGLNGFRGMLARTDAPSYWGIRFDFSWARRSEDWSINLAFLIGLLWKTIGTSRDKSTIPRRSMFPTWCWASLSAKIEPHRLLWFSASSVNAQIAVADYDGVIRTIADLYRSTKQHIKIIEELTTYLHITGFVTKVGLKVRGDGRRYQFDFGPVHPRVDVTISGFDYGWFSSWAYVDMFTDSSLMARLETQEWDAIALLGRHMWLILDWVDGVATRIGCIALLSLRDPGLERLDRKGGVRTIKLG